MERYPTPTIAKSAPIKTTIRSHLTLASIEWSIKNKDEINKIEDLQRIYRKWNPPTIFLGMQMANPLWKTAWCFQEIQDIEVPHDPAIPLMGLGPGKVKWNWLSRVWPFATPWTIRSVESPRQNTGVGSLSLLQGIFPTQGSSPGLPHCRQILYQLSHKGSPRILEWVAHPFSSGSSCFRSRTGVSCIADRFFTSWATREVQVHRKSPFKMTRAPWFSGQHYFNRQDMESTKRSTDRITKTRRYIYKWNPAATAAAKSLQLCLTLCDPIDGSPSGSPIPGILQARILEWVASSFCNAWKWKVKVKSLSRVRLPAIPWTAAYQAPLSMGLSRQEYWSGVHCLLHTGILLNHKIEWNKDAVSSMDELRNHYSKWGNSERERQISWDLTNGCNL